jgi:hypothetical protein
MTASTSRPTTAPLQVMTIENISHLFLRRWLKPRRAVRHRASARGLDPGYAAGLTGRQPTG